jgi:hypothetical protein
MTNAFGEVDDATGIKTRQREFSCATRRNWEATALGRARPWAGAATTTAGEAAGAAESSGELEETAARERRCRGAQGDAQLARRAEGRAGAWARAEAGRHGKPGTAGEVAR